MVLLPWTPPYDWAWMVGFSAGNVPSPASSALMKKATAAALTAWKATAG